MYRLLITDQTPTSAITEELCTETECGRVEIYDSLLEIERQKIKSYEEMLQNRIFGTYLIVDGNASGLLMAQPRGLVVEQRKHAQKQKQGAQ